MKSSIKLIRTGFLQVNTLLVPTLEGQYFITDPGGNADRIASVYKNLDIQQEPLAVILTHGHFDHIAGLKDLLLIFPHIPIFIHSADQSYLGANAGKFHFADFQHTELEEFVQKEAIEIPEPTKILADGDDVFGWKVIHTPGHSPGSICLYNATFKTLISGDTLFNNGYGRTDLHGGSLSELLKSLNKLRSLPPNTKVYPGHGSETEIGREL